ncbi:serine hydrolase [Caldalkalibacillus mannanilyticus]|uniref:serine hydrolase n=1 Tax=Caldalkalibacillus mannanilyticus TaxID=1418 RepID=UPI000468E2A2|nr:serine hydrolase [Caldalkalibacillus mannanilyticus]
MRTFGKLGSKLAITLLCVLLFSMLSGCILQSEKEIPIFSDQKAPGQEMELFADDFFQRPEIKENLAGAVFVVVRDDKILVKKGYGFADEKQQVLVDPDKTVFRVASVSKTITATAVMQLVEQGKIELNNDLSAYLGEIQIPNLTTGSLLKMKHLLTNSTGFEYGDTADSSTEDLTQEVSLEQYVRDHAPKVVRQPGEYYRYDNLGSTIQGYVIEQVTGQAFGVYVREHIFQPLGMENSDYRLTPSIMSQLAVPYNTLGEEIPIYATIPTELPGGGMLSTGSDMAQFMLAHLGGGKLGDSRILKEETIAEMHKPQLAIHPELPNMTYGFEYSNRQLYNGHYVIEKAGDLEGYHSGMWLLPDEKVGVFVSVNKDMEIRQELFQAFMDRFFLNKEEKLLSPEPLSPSQPSLSLFEGVYSDLRNRMWTSRIRVEGDKLVLRDPLGEHVLHQIEPFLFEDEQGVKAAFKLDEENRVTAFYYDLKSDSWARKMQEPMIFGDVEPDGGYAEYIYHLQQIEVIEAGGEQNRFQPEQPITREEFIGWFIRWAGIAPSKQEPIFADTKESPFVEEIQAAYEFGLIEGSDNGQFHPQQTLTRQEATLIVWRMAHLYLYAEPRETPVSETDSWALEGVRYVVEKELYGPEVVMDQEGVLDYKSKQRMSKQEATALLSRFAERLF